MRRDRMNPPKQQRSRETAERIISACERMLNDRTFAQITLADVCSEAEVSPSTLYSRFPSKEAIRHALVELYREQMTASFTDQYLHLLAEPPPTIDELTSQVVDALIAWVHHHDHLVTALKVEDAGTGMSFETEEMLVAGLTHLGAIVLKTDSPRDLRRIEFAIRAAAAIVQRAVGRHMTFAKRMTMTDNELTDEVTRMVSSYLTENRQGDSTLACDQRRSA
jgi:AcrR family transcriptional regulator